jgi:hypothetical protein
MSIILPCWSADDLTWEFDPLGTRHGTVWWSTPRGALGFAVYFDSCPNGFHCSLNSEFRGDIARQKFRHGLIKDTLELFPMARVPRSQR